MNKHSSSISFDDDFKKRIKNQLIGTETVSQFVFSATDQKLNRLESKDNKAREKTLMRDREILKEAIREIFHEMRKEGSF